MRDMVNNETFKASDGWIRGFRKRYSLTLRTPTEKKQYGKVIDIEVVRNFLNYLKEKDRNFLNYLKEKESLNQYTTIVNMDVVLDPRFKLKVYSKTQDPVALKEAAYSAFEAYIMAENIADTPESTNNKTHNK
jgi:hypothetical protein